MQWLLRCLVVFCLAAVSPAHGTSGGPPATGDDRDLTLIKTLNDADPALRALATKRLIDAGPSARPALCRAIATANPETSQRIAYVLLHMQWINDSDPEMVKQALLNYADADPDARRLKVDLVQQSQTIDPLLRVLLHDPCQAVRWQAAVYLAQILENSNVPLPAQISALVETHLPINDDYPPATQNAPLLALVGWSARSANPQHAQELMDRALAIEMADPSAYNGQADFAFNWLIDRATTKRQYDRVVQLLRAQSDRCSWDDQSLPPPVSNLLAAQADFGPMPGLDDDARNYRNYLTHPELIYTLARWMDRQNHPIVAGALAGVALSLGGTSADSHCITGTFLVQHNWGSAAERELHLCLALSGGTSINAYFQLADLANNRDDDLGVARNMEAGLKMLTDNAAFTRAAYGKRITWTAEDLWADVHWHYLRAARSANDIPGTKQPLEKLLTLDHDAQILQRDPGMAADVVPALQDLNRNEEADKIFDAAYAALSAQITAAPNEPMPKNNLAWLCAETNRKLDEAARLSAEAVELSPDDSACLDTQAETCFRQGQADRAIQIETHALQVKPDDLYMQKQLKRFKKQ